MSQPTSSRLRILITAGAAALLCLLLTGCETTRWNATSGVHEAPRNRYSVTLPDGWMRHRPGARGDLLLTRDGLLLQEASIEPRPISRGFPNTQQTISSGMLPHEIAAVLMDNLRGDTGLLQFTILKEEPRMISGKPAFQFMYEYASREGLKVRGVQAGFLEGETLWVFSYEAPRRHYFEHYLPDFQLILDTFALKKSQR